MSGCWSAVGTPIAQGDDVFTVLPATLAEDELERRLAEADAAVVMKVGRNLPKVRRALERTGRLARAVYVERGTMAGETAMPLADKPDDCAPLFRDRAGAGLGGAAVSGRLAVVGLGPGDARWLTPEAEAALGAADAFSVTALISIACLRVPDSAAMPPTIARKARAPRPRSNHAAAGANVALVSGGDPGVFAMAAAVCEQIEQGPPAWRELELAIVPGRHRDARGRGPGRRAARPRFLRHVAVRQSEALAS